MIQFKACCKNIQMSVSEKQSVHMDVENAVVVHTGKTYDGSYEVTPKVASQVIPTADRYMENDMTVKAIPFFDVSNNAGGNTIYIGSEV